MNRLMKIRRFIACRGGKVAGGAEPPKWWLAGGLAAADVVGAYQAIGAASYAASKVNLANPGTYDLIERAGAVTWAAATGWAGDGTHSFSMGVNGLGTWSYLIRYSGAGSMTLGMLNVAYSNDYRVLIAAYSWGISLVNKQAGVGLNYSGAVHAAGVLGIAGPGAYFDGTPLTTGAGVYGLTSSPVLILAQNASEILNAGNVQAVAVYNKTLSDAQMAAISASMAALTGG